KFGTGYNAITPLEIKTIRAVSRAHLATGAPIHSHTEAGTMALEQMKYLREEGIALKNVCFGHMDRNPDPWMHRKVAETGAYLSFDGIAKIKYNAESVRIRCILDLVRAGHQKQILVSGDTARKSYYYSYTYSVGLPYIINTWVPRLMEEANDAGLDGAGLVQDIFVNNPRECFTFKK
ncbi:MAG: phosphotriesterase, partial [Ruthenibacterium sp.]